MVILLVFNQSSFDEKITLKKINFRGVGLPYKKDGLPPYLLGVHNQFWYFLGCTASKEPGLSFRITFQSILLKQFDRR